MAANSLIVVLGYSNIGKSVILIVNITHLKILVFRPFQEKEKGKTNSGYKHNNKVSHGLFNLTFRMLQHTSSEVTVTKYDEI